MKDYIKKIIFGERKKGEKIISKKVSFNTIQPEKQLSYNEWCRKVEFGSAYIKHR